MDCAAARALLDSQSGRHQRSDDLRFHLASCAACRSYRTSRAQAIIDDVTLLSQLLNAESQDTPIGNQFRKAETIPVRKRSQRVHTFLKTLLIVTAVAAIFLVGTVALAAAVIHRNIQAIIVPTAPLPSRMQTAVIAAPPATRRIAVPTSVIKPSPLPQLAGRAPAIPTLLPTTQLPYPPSGDAINILVIGSDKRPDEEGDTRADTIMVVRVDPQHQRVALLSLPRDLIVAIPGYGQGRINAANAYGGVALVRSTVSNLLGIPIDYYVSVNFEGFIAVVDAVGGVDVNIESELYDPEFPTMDYGYTVAHFLPGPQHMDGATALMYSRIRHPDSDYNRMKRQQQVMVAVGTALQQQNALQSLQSLVTISNALRGFIQTDMPEDTMLGLAWSFHALSPDAVERYTLGADQVTENVIAGDPYASFALPGAIDTLIQQFIGQ